MRTEKTSWIRGLGALLIAGLAWSPSSFAAPEGATAEGARAAPADLVLRPTPVDGGDHLVPVDLASRLRGGVFQPIPGPDGLAESIVPVTGVTIDLRGPEAGTRTSDASGAYEFIGLPRGRYEVVASLDDGRQIVAPIDVAEGSAGRVTFYLSPDDDTGGFVSYASIAIGTEEIGPDFDGNGQVELSDLQVVELNLGGDADRLSGDVNGDGAINGVDLHLVRAAMGKAVLRLPALYQAQVTPGGTKTSVASGLMTAMSGRGYTKGEVTTTGDPGVVRFTVIEDRGSASSPEIGDFLFSEDKSNPTWIEVDLDTGRVVGGLLTLVLDGAAFGESATAVANIPDGFVNLVPDGFETYCMVGITGELSAGFPLLPSASFSMAKKERKKKDKACDTVQEPRGSAKCNLGGTTCANQGAKCAKNGKCGKCASFFVTTRRGKSCNGCRCNTLGG